MHDQMPRPTDAHKKLQALAGTWVAEEKIHPSPWDAQGGSAVSETEARLDLDGFFLVMDYRQKRGDQVTYRGHGVFGWDATKSAYTMHWFDSMGSPCGEPALGKWEGSTLRFEHQTPMGHARYVYTFEGEGRYAFRIENSQDGKTWAPFIESQHRRKS